MSCDTYVSINKYSFLKVMVHLLNNEEWSCQVVSLQIYVSCQNNCFS